MSRETRIVGPIDTTGRLAKNQCASVSELASRQDSLPQTFVGASGVELRTHRQIGSLRAKKLAVHHAVDVGAGCSRAAIAEHDIDDFMVVRRGEGRSAFGVGRVLVDAADGGWRIGARILEVE